MTNVCYGFLIDLLFSIVLASHLVSHMQTDKKDIFHYFCSEPAKCETRVLRLLRTWIAQILATGKQLASLNITGVFNESTRGASSVEELRTAVFQFVKCEPPVTFLVDGLDECDSEDFEQIVQIMSYVSQYCQAVIFSRDDQRLESSRLPEEVLHLNAEHTANDTSTIVREEMRNVHGPSYSNPELIDVTKSAIQRCQGLHLYARLCLDLLHIQTTISEMKSVVQGTP